MWKEAPCLGTKPMLPSSYSIFMMRTMPAAMMAAIQCAAALAPPLQAAGISSDKA